MPQEQAVTWHDALTGAFAFLKAPTRPDEAWVRSLAIGDGEGFLLPVCALHARDADTIALLARWRDGAQHAFPTRFPVTLEGTARWLDAALLTRPERMLWLVADPVGRPIGHLGLVLQDGELEVDNVIRGEAGAPGLMGAALGRLLAWAEEEAHPPRALLRVLASNEHAIRFYRRLGFSDGPREALRLHVEGDRQSLVPQVAGDDAEPDDVFLTMRAPALPAEPGELATAGPSVGPREAAYAVDAALNGWNGRWREYLDRFEQGFAAYLGVPHALATSSGTGALHLAFASLGLGPGDEVIVPDVTWVATANAVAYTGARPIFVDVEPDTWCLDPAAFEAAITERTRAVVPVHLYGQPARIEAIVEIARRHRLAVVEDAAPAIGATRHGVRVGTFGDVAAFSFQGAKLLVTGEGGMLVTSRDDVAARARFLADQGRVPGTFDIEALGYKYKMANVQAAIGLAQLERVEPMIEAKRRIHQWYAEGLAGVPGIDLQREADGSRSIYWMTNVRIGAASGTTRDAVRAHLRSRGIDTRPVFPSVGAYPFWADRQPTPPVAAGIAAEGINLPSGVRLGRADVQRVCRSIHEVVDVRSAAA